MTSSTSPRTSSSPREASGDMCRWAILRRPPSGARRRVTRLSLAWYAERVR
jgi:hypothetical protein